MDARTLYRLTGPTEWAQPPARYSHSSLRVMGECPLRWQLRRSSYGELRGFPERPRPSALVGKIVHQVLDRLFKALAARGLPEVGSTAFREAVAELGLLRLIQEELTQHHTQLAQNPRASGARISEGPREIYNQACRLFHPVYAQARAGRPTRVPEDRLIEAHPVGAANILGQLRARGALTELRLEHPSLPLIGIIDLLWDDHGRTRIIDFKTGTPRPEHHEQLDLYALLWWRITGDIPGQLDLWYPDGCQSFSVDEDHLRSIEDRVQEQIAEMHTTMAQPPAAARLGPHCRFCDVRQFCDLYWTQPPCSSPEGWLDAELTVVAVLSESSLQCAYPSGAEVMVTFDEEIVVRHSSFHPGERLRILGAHADQGTRELRLLRGAELFHYK